MPHLVYMTYCVGIEVWTRVGIDVYGVPRCGFCKSRFLVWNHRCWGSIKAATVSYVAFTSIVLSWSWIHHGKRVEVKSIKVLCTKLVVWINSQCENEVFFGRHRLYFTQDKKDNLTSNSMHVTIITTSVNCKHRYFFAWGWSRWLLVLICKVRLIQTKCSSSLRRLLRGIFSHPLTLHTFRIQSHIQQYSFQIFLLRQWSVVME